MDYFLLTNNLTKAIGMLNDLIDSTNFCTKSAIITWKIDLPNVKKAQSMFQGSSIKNFKGDLSKCENTNQMFRECTQFYKFESKLPMLIDGSWMFHYFSKINHWDIELPNLVNGQQMFGWYSKLTYFHSETPKLVDGGAMFDNNTDLTSFKGNLSSLKKGGNMFTLCKLDLESIKNIAETINDLTGQSLSSDQGTITIGMSANIRGLQETTDALALIRSKGWTVTEQYN